MIPAETRENSRFLETDSARLLNGKIRLKHMLKRLIRFSGLPRLLNRLRPHQAAGEIPLHPAASIKIKKVSGNGFPARVNTQPSMKPTVAPLGQGHPQGAATTDQPPTFLSEIVLHDSLDAYLTLQGNSPQDIAVLHRILMMDQIILETGCGGAEIAWEIARKNPNTGVIATDKYDLTGVAGESSHYGKVARAWQEGCLKTQQSTLPNLIILKAESEILQFLPDNSIDSILVINPEPVIGAAFVESIEKSGLLGKVKPGRKRIVIKPYSREMNVMSCGGYEFDHSEDWSCGLGFVLGSTLPFKKVHAVQWCVDLSSVSPYCKNSTQNCVYALGDKEG